MDQEAQSSTPVDNIAQTGSVTARTRRGVIHSITIVGQIEGHMEAPQQTKTTKYEHIIPQITAVEESDEIDGLLVLLNTVGGDVEAGLAIAELIAGMRKPTVSLVLGGGHSIGVPLAVAAKRSFIAPSAAMTIHPVRMSGTVIASPQTYTYFQKIQERIVGFITAHSHVSAKEFTRMMMETAELSADTGTIVSGEEAVACGLIDQVGSLSDALDALHQMIDARRPLCTLDRVLDTAAKAPQKDKLPPAGGNEAFASLSRKAAGSQGRALRRAPQSAELFLDFRFAKIN